MFFVAYTKDGEDVGTRPVSFLYNGGPGAATSDTVRDRTVDGMERRRRRVLRD